MIKITYQEDCEMMAIEDDGCVIFYGNYGDFDRSPRALKDFLTLLEHDVIVKEGVLEV